jgi:hypothetical protein
MSEMTYTQAMPMVAQHLLANTPLQQTKPRCILSALKYRVCGFAAERQAVMPRHQHRKPSDVVMYGVATEFGVAGALPSA